MNRAHSILATALASLLLLGACGEEIEEPVRDGVYVGQFDGSESLLAFAVKGDTIVAYVCGDRDHWRSVAGIFSGTLSTKDGSFTVNNELDLRNVGVVGEGTAEGWLELRSGEMLHWSASRVPEGGKAGLYLADSAEAFTGLIVTEDDQANGANYEEDCCSSFVAIDEFDANFASVDVTAKKCGEYGEDAVFHKTLTKLTTANVKLRQGEVDRFKFEADPQVWYLDVDMDGFGQDGRTLFSCAEAPYRGATMAGDCDDMDPTVNPGAGNCN